MNARLLLAVFVFIAARGARAADQAGIDFFEEKIRPVLAAKCYECHSARAKEVQSGLRLDTREAARRGGDTGHAVVPGKPGESLLIAALRHENDLEMPPDEKLPASVIADFVRWIEIGAPDPREGASDGVAPEELRRRAREHWAYRPPQRPALPAGDAPATHPIDALLAAAHRRRGLTAAPEAPRGVLLRRVYLDLVGVPPTPDQQAQFERDAAPDAYERVVERLLASPLHGQRWGRHWMDVWRYSDWYGWNAEVRNSQKHIWHWRDWIVESLNADKSYDRMVQEMLAADELAPGDPDALRATGFLARNWYRYDRNLWLVSTVEHTGKAFLGLTVNCARCHDHKFDPLLQSEYYQLRAVFEPHDVRTDPLPGEPSVEVDGVPRVYDARPDEPTYRFVRGNDKQPDKEHPLRPELPAAWGAAPLAVAAIDLPREAYLPALRSGYQQDLLARADRELRTAGEKLAGARQQASQAEATPNAATKTLAAEAVSAAEHEAAVGQAKREALAAAIAADEARHQAPPAATAADLIRAAALAQRRVEAAVAKRDAAAGETKLATLRRENKPPAEIEAQQKQVGELQAKLVAARKAVDAPGESYTSTVTVYPSRSTGRRLALARWITDRQNPLAARVAVNHLWARHFGRPLVATAENFGISGKPPQQPELLDWLAVELMEHGWSMKHLHRLMVTSAAYRRQSSVGADWDTTQAADPGNEFFWRQNARRLDGETIRDSVLAIAGRLDVSAGGPPLDETTALETTRRSLYYRHTPQDRAKFLELFDGANPEACYLRGESIMPQQALAMLNNTLVRQQARRLAERLAAGGDDAQFAAAAFALVLARPPSEAERDLCVAFLRQQSELLSAPAALSQFPGAAAPGAAPLDPRQRAREDLLHTLLNHNDFVTVR